MEIVDVAGDPDFEVVTVQGLAQRIRLSPTAVYKRIARGTLGLPVVRLNRSIRIVVRTPRED